MSVRNTIRGMLPSHVVLGSEAIHSREPEESRPALTESCFDTEEENGECPFSSVSRKLNQYESGDLTDPEILEMFQALIKSGVIEYLNTDLQKVARDLIQDGHLRNHQERSQNLFGAAVDMGGFGESQFGRDTEDQEAQKSAPHIQVKASRAYKSNSATAPVATRDTGQQKAHAGPAQVPTPPSGQATTVGHQDFSTSGDKENPARVPKAAGSQKAGPNHGDGMSGPKQGMKVGHSLQQSAVKENDRSLRKNPRRKR
jgi:hypothetical protein